MKRSRALAPVAPGRVGRVAPKRRLLTVFALGVAASLSLASCSATEASTSTSETETALNLNLNRDLSTLDNKTNQYDALVTVQRAVRQALTEIGSDLTPSLVLASSFEATGPTEWTVELRDDITYSDGSPVEVEDVETALKLYFEVPASFVASQFPEQPVLTKVDDRTFTLTTTEPVVTLPSLMSNILITPAEDNEAADLQDGIGTGPYVVAESDPGTGTYTLEANPNYWGEAPKTKTVHVTYTPDESNRLIAIETGQVDVIDSITSDSATYLEGKDGIGVTQTPGTRLIHLAYNFRVNQDSPIADPKVREALSYAVDHETLISALMAGQVTSAVGVVPETLAGFTKTGEYAYDPEKAKKLLAEAGRPSFELTAIWEDGEFSGAPQVMEALVTMLADVGVTLNLKQIPQGGEMAEWRYGDKTSDWDILANGYGNQTGLALTNLEGQWAGTPEAEATKETYNGFVVPEITALIQEAGKTTDEDARNALLADAQQQIWEQWPAMWAWTPSNVLAKRDTVGGLELRPTNSFDLSQVTVGE